MHLIGNSCGASCIPRNHFRSRRCLSPVLRNRVVAKLTRKRMASQKPLQSQPYSACYAESFNRLVGIARTRRFEPAAPRKQDGQIGFVKPQREQPERHAHMRPRICKGGACPTRLFACDRRGSRSHLRAYPVSHYTLFSRRSKSAVSAANAARVTELLGCMTMSHPAGISVRWH